MGGTNLLREMCFQAEVFHFIYNLLLTLIKPINKFKIRNLATN